MGKRGAEAVWLAEALRWTGQVCDMPPRLSTRQLLESHAGRRLSPRPTRAHGYDGQQAAGVLVAVHVRMAGANISRPLAVRSCADKDAVDHLKRSLTLEAGKLLVEYIIINTPYIPNCKSFQES